MNSTGEWKKENDKNSGSIELSNDKTATKFTLIECYKLWIYGMSKSSIKVKLNDEEISNNEPPKNDSIQLFESNEFPFQLL